MRSDVEAKTEQRIEIGPADPGDLERVAALLASHDLPTDGLEQCFDRFLIARKGDELVGAIGMERHGDFALLRSAVVSESWQGRGVGRQLVERLLEEVRASRAKAVYLLTTRAEQYFPAFGFARVERESVPAELMASPEFQGACPSSATVMRREVENVD